MHLSLILLMVGVAIGVRLGWRGIQPGIQPSALNHRNEWATRWQLTLSAFLIPPLLLFSTAIAVLGMGHHGMMLGLPVGRLGCLMGLSFLSMAAGLLLWQGGQTWRSVQQIKSYPLCEAHSRQGYLLDTPILFAAEIGWWQSSLVISRGFLETLTVEQMDAALNHEQAHRYYRDPFWFFWLGWIRRITCWLPYTDSLWQELLLLRELRADRWAARSVDPLVLAETLLLFAQSPADTLPYGGVAFNAVAPVDRLEARIDSLLSDFSVPEPTNGYVLLVACLWSIFLPLLTLLLHQSITC